MEEIFNNIKPEFIYVALVVILTIIFLFATKYVYKLFLRQLDSKFSIKDISKIKLTKKILYTLWVILGLIALIAIFIDKKYYTTVENSFFTTLYLGVIAVATLISVTFVQVWFSKKIYKKTLENEDTTNYKFVRYVAIYGVYFIGIIFMLFAFNFMKDFLVAVLGSAGILAVVAGVASQEALSNLVGGIFIIVFKPFKVGNTIQVDDNKVGTVTDITLRHTIIRDYQNKMIVIPNAVINKEKLVNYDLNEKKCCEWVIMDISYDSDIDKAKKIMREECEKHPLLVDNRTTLQKTNNDDIVTVRVTSLNDSSISIRAWVWAATYGNGFVMKCELLESIKKRFDEEGIEIPFPYRTLVMKNEGAESIKP